jgi:hypothetical protein
LNIRIGARAVVPGLSLVACLTLLAATPPATAEPSRDGGGWGIEARDLLIESVTVEGAKRASPELIVAESLIEIGRSYSERELQAAVRRIQRLPFILDTRVSLRKGSRRGAYELVIAVVETRRFFFGTDLEFATLGSPLGLSDLNTAEPGFTDQTSDLSLLLGARGFVGAHGVVFGGLGDQGLQVGYAHYDLLDRGIFASIQVSGFDGCCFREVFSLGLDPALSAWNVEHHRRVAAEAAVPLSVRRAIRVSLSWTGSSGSLSRNPLLPEERRFDGRLFFRERTDLDLWELAVRWVHDTNDDPVLPTRGLFVSAGLRGESLYAPLPLRGVAGEGLDPGLDAVPDDTVAPYRARHLALESRVTRHLPVTSRQTVSVGARAAVGRASLDGFPLRIEDAFPPFGMPARVEIADDLHLTTYEVSLAVRWALDLLQPSLRRTGDLRLELETGYGYEATSPNLDLPGNPVEAFTAAAGLVYRSRWGVFRFAFTYLDAGEVLR